MGPDQVPCQETYFYWCSVIRYLLNYQFYALFLRKKERSCWSGEVSHRKRAWWGWLSWAQQGLLWAGHSGFQSRSWYSAPQPVRGAPKSSSEKKPKATWAVSCACLTALCFSTDKILILKQVGVGNRHKTRKRPGTSHPTVTSRGF